MHAQAVGEVVRLTGDNRQEPPTDTGAVQTERNGCTSLLLLYLGWCPPLLGCQDRRPRHLHPLLLTRASVSTRRYREGTGQDWEAGYNPHGFCYYKNSSAAAPPSALHLSGQIPAPQPPSCPKPAACLGRGELGGLSRTSRSER